MRSSVYFFLHGISSKPVAMHPWQPNHWDWTYVHSCPVSHILYNKEVAASTQAYVPYTWSYFTSVLQTSIWPTDLDCSSYHNWLLLLTLARNQSRLADNYADLKTFCLHTIKWTLLLTDYAPSISTNHPWVKLQHWAHQNHFWTQKAQTDQKETEKSS
jgi:hypothetical protein